MPDMASVSAALSGLKTATEIARYLRSTETAFETADLKLQIADLVDALATAKLSMAEVQDELMAKDEEIRRLQDALDNQAKVVRFKLAYYEVTETGQPIGDPYCSSCFEQHHKLIHLNQNPRARMESVCPACKNVYPRQIAQSPDNA